MDTNTTKTITLGDGRTVVAYRNVTVPADAKAHPSWTPKSRPAAPHAPNHVQWSLETGRVEHYWAPRTTPTDDRRSHRLAQRWSRGR